MAEATGYYDEDYDQSEIVDLDHGLTILVLDYHWFLFLDSLENSSIREEVRCRRTSRRTLPPMVRSSWESTMNRSAFDFPRKRSNSSLKDNVKTSFHFLNYFFRYVMNVAGLMSRFNDQRENSVTVFLGQLVVVLELGDLGEGVGHEDVWELRFHRRVSFLLTSAVRYSQLGGIELVLDEVTILVLLLEEGVS